jgi:type II secretory pathway pseudopilin PulG
MTLLEAVVALVILALTGVGYLEVFQGDARAVRNASDWTRAVAVGESAMESVLAGGGNDGVEAVTATSDSGVVVQLHETPWRGRVHDMQVDVRMPDGRVLRLHRLSREPLP